MLLKLNICKNNKKDGTYGTVYCAQDKITKKLVALKKSHLIMTFKYFFSRLNAKI